MVSANDPVESFYNSIQVVKDVFSPLESGIRKAVKDLEHCWPGSKKGANNSLQVVATQLTDDRTKNGNEVQICSVEKKSCQCVVGNERKKGLSKKVPVKMMCLGFFSRDCGSSGHKINRANKGLKEVVVNEDGTCSNCVKFAITWSLLVNGLIQAFPSPFKAGKNRFHKTNDDNKFCIDLRSHVSMSNPRSSREVNKKESKGHFVTTFQNEDLKQVEGDNSSIECFIGFVCDQLTQNLRKFDPGVQERECESCDLPPTPCSPTDFNHLRAFVSILEGKRIDVNGFFGNLRFARVGGVPSSMVEVTSVKEEGDDSVTASSEEENGDSSPQKLASGLLSIPLSNVERLRSTLSTVSFTELIELIPHLGQSSKDYPNKKKLFSVQDFFRYTESEGMFRK